MTIFAIFTVFTIYTIIDVLTAHFVAITIFDNNCHTNCITIFIFNWLLLNAWCFTIFTVFAVLTILSVINIFATYFLSITIFDNNRYTNLITIFITNRLLVNTWCFTVLTIIDILTVHFVTITIFRNDCHTNLVTIFIKNWLLLNTWCFTILTIFTILTVIDILTVHFVTITIFNNNCHTNCITIFIFNWLLLNTWCFTINAIWNKDRTNFFACCTIWIDFIRTYIRPIFAIFWTTFSNCCYWLTVFAIATVIDIFAFCFISIRVFCDDCHTNLVTIFIANRLLFDWWRFTVFAIWYKCLTNHFSTSTIWINFIRTNIWTVVSILSTTFSDRSNWMTILTIFSI